MGLILRKDISRKLTIQEMDGNFTYLESLSKNTSGNLTDATTTVWDYSQFNIANWTIGGNRTLSIINPVVNKGGLIYLTQDATGGRVPTLPGAVPTIGYSPNPGDLDVLGFFYNGTRFIWTIVNYGSVSTLPRLNAPTLLTVATSSTQINLSVGTVSNATSYKFERATNLAFTSGVTLLQNTLSTTYSDTGLTPATTYYYRCTSQASGYLDGVSSVQSVTTLGVSVDYIVWRSLINSSTASGSGDLSGNGSLPSGGTGTRRLAISSGNYVQQTLESPATLNDAAVIGIRSVDDSNYTWPSSTASFVAAVFSYQGKGATLTGPSSNSTTDLGTISSGNILRLEIAPNLADILVKVSYDGSTFNTLKTHVNVLNGVSNLYVVGVIALAGTNRVNAAQGAGLI